MEFDREQQSLHQPHQALDRLRPRLDVVAYPDADPRAHAVNTNTRRSYRGDVADYVQWCKAAGEAHVSDSVDCDAETLARYLRFLGQEVEGDSYVFQQSTIARRVAAVDFARREAGLLPISQHKEVRYMLSGIRNLRRDRERKMAQGGQPLPGRRGPARALPLQTLESAVAACRPGCAGARDKALLLVAYHGAFRSEEIVRLRWSDVELCRGGAIIRLSSSKRDQLGKGQEKPIPELPGHMCPVAALTHWRSFLTDALPSEPVFCGIRKGGAPTRRPLDRNSVRKLLRRVLCRGGMTEAEAKTYCAHSLRHGFVTDSVLADVSPYQIQGVTKQSLATLSTYYNPEDLLAAHPSHKLRAARKG